MVFKGIVWSWVNCPSSVLIDMLSCTATGYKEARLVPSKPGISFVDFENEMQASVALSGLQGFKITPQHAMRITYAKQ